MKVSVLQTPFMRPERPRREVFTCAVDQAGLPVSANLTGGPLSVLKPSFGLVIGFVAGSAVPFVFGPPYLAVALCLLGLDDSAPAVIVAGLTPFIPGGVIKAAIAAAIIPLAWRAVRRLDGTRS